MSAADVFDPHAGDRPGDHELPDSLVPSKIGCFTISAFAELIQRVGDAELRVHSALDRTRPTSGRQKRRSE